MPGLLSSIFDGGSDESQSTSGSDGSDTSYDSGEGSSASDGSGEYQSDSSSYSAGAENDTHLDPSVDVGVGMGGSYETPDGTTHSWENSQDVSLTTDTHAVTEVGGMLTTENESFG